MDAFMGYGALNYTGYKKTHIHIVIHFNPPTPFSKGEFMGIVKGELWL
jgi:hypothetical protein